MTAALIRKGEETQKEDSHMRTKAEMELMLTQAKEYLELPEAGRSQKQSSPRGFGRSIVLTKL